MPRDEAYYAQVIDLYRTGLRPREIVAKLGVTPTQARRAVRKAVVNGDIIPHKDTRETPFKEYSRLFGVGMGSIGGLGKELTADQYQWLVDEAVRTGCGTVQEYLAELVRDAIEEQTLSRK